MRATILIPSAVLAVAGAATAIGVSMNSRADEQPLNPIVVHAPQRPPTGPPAAPPPPGPVDVPAPPPPVTGGGPSMNQVNPGTWDDDGWDDDWDDGGDDDWDDD